jgi:hypothetical protein
MIDLKKEVGEAVHEHLLKGRGVPTFFFCFFKRRKKIIVVKSFFLSD